MNAVRFLLEGKVQTFADADPTMTVLDWLRTRAGRTGTKEGCAEGDCGACTVVVGSLTGDHVTYRAVNACILFLPMLDGKVLITVESLKRDGILHPVQQAMVDLHGSQCGFCTPGIVMSLYARAIGATGDAAPADVLAGNLCRCTGYGPILAAAEACPPAVIDDRDTVVALKALKRDDVLRLEHDGKHWFAPATSDQLAALLLDHPQARIVAGATDVGLWVTKQQRVLPEIISICDIADLAILTETDEGLTLGAGVRYSDAWKAFGNLHPDLGELVRRIAGTQVRNSGTIGGNIANGSPIGDTPPALIALGARLTLRKGDVHRVIDLEDFFVEYGRQDRQVSEFVESIFIPRLDRQFERLRIVKLSKRFDSDISAVCAAIKLRLENNLIIQVRVAFGGMAGTPKRARHAENALIGKPWSAEAFEAAAAALAQDFQPLSDARGSRDYRLLAAANVLRRMAVENGTVLDMEPIHA
jgi:xanthine dehydrogenase small subunit